MVVWTSKHAKYEAKRRSDSDLLERKRASRRKHHAANAERLNAARTERRQGNPEPHRRAVRRYAATPHGREVARMRDHRRRAREVGARVEIVHSLVLLERDDGVCGICGRDVNPEDFHVDHVVPLARGGDHSYANTQVAHPLCNQRKNARLLEEVA